MKNTICSIFALITFCLPQLALTAPIVDDSVSFKEIVPFQIMPDSTNEHLFWYTPAYEFELCPGTKYVITKTKEHMGIRFQMCATETIDQERLKEIEKAQRLMGPGNYLVDRPLLKTTIYRNPQKIAGLFPIDAVCAAGNLGANSFLCNIRIAGSRAVETIYGLMKSDIPILNYFGLACSFDGLEYQDTGKTITKNNVVREEILLIPTVRAYPCHFIIKGSKRDAVVVNPDVAHEFNDPNYKEK